MGLLEPGLELLPGLTLLRPLGRGGMGEAWLARDAQRGEDVVAKVVPAAAPPESVALLRREARLVRKLSHPRIVPVYGFRGGERGSALTRRYMPGGDAGRLRGRPPLEVARLGRDVAEALEYLHGLGVVHRDVKASNVLLDDEGRAGLADFGIAAAAWNDEEGIVVRGGGSRASLSPQQIAGEEAQPSDDLYALGALLYELLSGRPAFPPEASDAQIRESPPPPLAPVHPVPEALGRLVARLLSKAPAERPSSAAAVRRELEGLLPSIAASRPATPPPGVRLQAPPRADPLPAIEPRDPRGGAGVGPPRPTRAGLSARQGLLLLALGAATVAAVFALPLLVREGHTPPAPGPAAEAAPPTPEATPRGTALLPREPEAAGPVAPPAPTPAIEAPIQESGARPRPPRDQPLAPAPPGEPAPLAAPAPTPDRQAEAAALARHRDAARALEGKEEWAAALAEYERALTIDPHVTFALGGRERAAQRAALAEALDFHARNPLRLTAEPVAREAEALLERARAVEPSGPRLRAQVEAVARALADARTTVAVVIESDGLTEVAVSRVGRLGTLTRRAVDLRPGEYTATGTRRGFRDVRRRFTVSPGAAVPPVVVRCEEAL
jgi:serine/threonine-protein kinase